MTVQNEATTTGVIMTDTAAAKVGALLEQEGRDDLRLRIAVQPGGCSGLRYQLYFDEREMDGDVDAEFSGVHVVTDKMSAPYLMGATIDFVDTIEKQGFTSTTERHGTRLPAVGHDRAQPGHRGRAGHGAGRGRRGGPARRSRGWPVTLGT